MTTTTIRELVDQLTDAAKMAGWDTAVLVETERDPEARLVIDDVETTIGGPDDDEDEDYVILVTRG